MSNYIIRFIEKPTKVGAGSLAVDGDEREIINIDSEKDVRKAIEQSFSLAIKILNDKVKEVSFTVEGYDNRGIWCGEGFVMEEKLKISSLNKI